jgi:hypothetical protein
MHLNNMVCGRSALISHFADFRGGKRVGCSRAPESLIYGLNKFIEILLLTAFLIILKAIGYLRWM